MPALTAVKCKSWFVAVENCLLEALDDEALDVDVFDEALQNFLLDDEAHIAPDITGDLEHGVRAPLNGELDLPHALLGIAAGMPDNPLRSCSIWWGQGSERIAPGLVFSRGLPGPGKFTALLDGNWADHGWRESHPPTALAADVATV
jgi:type VI secretion system protein ImpM